MTADKSSRNIKCKKWEKERRDRLNDSFNILAKLLPCYDPSTTISKLDILSKSADYIFTLKSKLNESLSTNSDNNKLEHTEIIELQKQVIRLTTRNEQLANLLKDANIFIPTEYRGHINVGKPKKWSGKITNKKAEEINKLESQKENKKDGSNQKDTSKENPELLMNVQNVKKKVTTNRGKNKPMKTITSNVNSKTNMSFTNVPLQSMQPYYIIANNITSTLSSQAPTIVKNVISTPILSSTNNSTKPFTSGIIYPVMQPAGLLNSPLILNTVPHSNSLIVVKNKTDQSANKNDLLAQTPKTISKEMINKPHYRKLKPKRRILNQRLLQGNKLPISASRYDSSLIIWSSAPQPVVKKRIRIVKRKRKKPDNNDKNNQKAKKAKIQEQEKTSQETKKSQSSDYSIDALCKENQSSAGKEFEKVVILEDVQCKVSENLKEAASDGKQSQEKVALIPSQITTAVVESKQNVASDNQIATPSNLLLQSTNNLQTNQLNYQQKPTVPEQLKCHTFNQNLITTNQVLNDRHSTQTHNEFHIQPNNSLILNKSPTLNKKQANITTKSQPTCGDTTQNSHIQHSNHQLTQHQHQMQTQQVVQTNSQVIQQNTQQQHQQLHQSNQPELNLHSELSNEIFASLQVQGTQNPESTSPTAAFLNAFPLVSSFTGVKVAEVMEEETTNSPNGTPTLLQIGNLETNQKATQNNPDNLTPSIMNLDSFNFFSNNLYNNFDNIIANTTTTANNSVLQPTVTTTISKQIKVSNHVSNCTDNTKASKVIYNQNDCLIMTSVNNNIKEYRNPASNSSNNNIIDKKAVQGKSIINNNGNNINQSNNNNKSYVFNSVSSSQPFYDNTSKAVVSSGINFNTSNRCNEYNTFNPFELPKTTQAFVKNHNDSITASSYGNNNCNYNYQTADYNYHQLGKNNYYDANNCNFYNGNNNNNPISNTNTNTNSLILNNSQNLNSNNSNNKYNKKSLPSKDNLTKTMVNWMAPDFSSTSTTSLAKVTSYSDIGQNNYINNTNALYNNEYQNPSGITMDTPQEHQFPWSPSKLPQLIDSAHNFPATTLPTLVGDLALGISTTYSTTTPIFDKKQKHNIQNTKKQTTHNSNFEPANFLSVSQLVEHNKDPTSSQTPTARIGNRRNSANRNVQKQQTTHTKTATKRHNKEKEKSKMCDGIDWDTKRNKNPISNYSAESLIGAKQQNFPKTIPPYMPDNLLPYFPHNIDDNFPQSNQNYQNNTYNNTFMQASTTTTYLPTTNFLPEMFENPIENIFSHVNHSTKTANSLNQPATHKKTQQKTKDVPTYSSNAIAGVTTKTKTKKKDSFVDLSFLSMPPINSPILPEDYHTNFIPPPPNHNQLYSSCKNPIYKQTSGNDFASILSLPTSSTTAGVSRTSAIQHPEVSPASGTLTNFNLCTIFPEINRANNVVPDMFRNYGHNSTAHKNTNYLPNLE